MEPLICAKQLAEEYREKCKKLCTLFVNLEKAYERVPKYVLKWTLIRKEVPKMRIDFIQDMYESASASVKIYNGGQEYMWSNRKF